MSLTQNDYTDIGTLVAFAIRPTQRPGRNPEYQRVLARYRTERDLRSATDAFLHGLSIQVLSDGDYGLVLGVEPESPLAFRISDMANTGDDRNKLLAGLVLTGLAGYAYPSAEELEDDRVRHVSERDFDNWLHELCARLRSHDAAGEVIPEQGLDEAWRIYADMQPVLYGDRGRGSGKLLKTCTRYWVHNMLGWLGTQGMARPDSSTEDGWTLTERFRVHAREIALERAYSFIAEVRRRTEPDPGSPDGTGSSPESDPETSEEGGSAS